MFSANSLKLTKIDIMTAVKAIAITMVVANHAGFAHELHISGGMNILLLISGISMATFAFYGTTEQTIASFRRFAIKVGVPSFVIALLWQIAVWNISFPELAFINNWITIERVVKFPIWYSQVIVQLMILLSILFWYFDLTKKIKNNPVGMTGFLLFCACLLCMISNLVWNTARLKEQLPNTLGWTFVFGWFFWAVTKNGHKTLQNKVLLSVVLAVCEYFVYQTSEIINARFYWLYFFVLLLIWWDYIWLPTTLARVVIVISQATFYIFLIHRFCFTALRKFGELVGVNLATEMNFVRFLFSLAVPCLIWALTTATIRAYRKTCKTCPI